MRIAAIRDGREPRQARCLLYSDIVACGHALCLGGLQLWIIVQCDVDCLCWRRRKARKRRRRLEVDGRHADEPQIVCSARNELRARRLPLAPSQGEPRLLLGYVSKGKSADFEQVAPVLTVRFKTFRI